MKSQRFIAWCLGFSFVFSILSGPFLFLFLRTDLVPARGRIYLFISALGYASPLLLALFKAPLCPSADRRFRGMGWMDLAAATNALYWGTEIVLGFVGGNEIRYVISDGLNFLIPSITYFVSSRLADPRERMWLFTVIERSLLIALPLHLVYTFASIHIFGQQSGGLIFYLLMPCWFFGKLLNRMTIVSLGTYLASLLLVLGSLKRAQIAGLVLHLPMLPFLVNRVLTYSRALMISMLGLAAALVLVTIAPDRFRVDTVWERMVALREETGGFTHLQSRQDEIVGGMAAVDDPAKPLGLFFGLGAGATYTVSYGAASGNTAGTTWNKLNNHDAHFTPLAWYLRGGLVGVGLNCAFYLLGLGLALLAVWRTQDLAQRIFLASLTTFVLTAVLVSVSSFSLTPDPMPHLFLGLILSSQRTNGARERETQS